MSLERWNANLIIKKDPDAELDYGFDWSEWLQNVPEGESADTIESSTWAVTGEDSSLTVGATGNDDTTTTVWLSGGTVGLTYVVRNRIVTADGRTDDRSFRMAIRQR